MTDAELLALVKRFDNAIMAFYETMKAVDKREPRLTATMRKHGLIQQAQEIIESGGAAISACGREIDARSRGGR